MSRMVTRYEVETVYTVKDDATRNVTALDAKTRQLDRSILGVGRGIGSMLKVFGGLTAVSLVVQGVRKTFGNLNSTMETSLTLAAQFSKSFEFSKNPVDNYNEGLLRSSKLIADLGRDAAALPGELGDFTGAANQLSGPVFASGGSSDDVRRLVAQLSFVGPMSGARNMQESSRQAMMILQGRAEMQSPLFAFLSQTMGAAQTVNSMDPAKRLEAFSSALAELSDNPAFRERYLNTFSVQWGTFTDALFGPRGITAALAGDAFNGAISGLRSLNDLLGTLSSYLHRFNDPQITALRDTLLVPGRSEAAKTFADREGALSKAAQEVARSATERGVQDLLASGYTFKRMTNRLVLQSPDGKSELRIADIERNLGTYWLKTMRSKLEALDAEASTDRKTPTVPVHQEFHIKVDVQTDASPEAIAVAIQRKQEEQMARAPTRGRRSFLRVNPGGELR